MCFVGKGNQQYTFPTSHVWLATVQVLAPPSLSKIESILPEETMFIRDGIIAVTSASCSHNDPSVASVGAMVPEEHPGMTTTLKHLKPHQVPPSTNLSPGRSAAPAVQAIIVNCVFVVKPQLAPIIGVNLEVVTPRLEDSEAACPTHSEVVVTAKSRPSATCVTIVHNLVGP